MDRLQHLNNITHLNLDVMLAMADCYFKDGDVIRAHYQYRQVGGRDLDLGSSAGSRSLYYSMILLIADNETRATCGQADGSLCMYIENERT